MKRWINYFVIGFILLLYIYSVEFTFLPLTGKQFVELSGMVVFIFTGSKKRLQRKYFSLLLLSFFIFLWGIITMLINASNQMIYIQHVIGPLAAFFGAYLIHFVSRKTITTLTVFFRFVVWVVFFQSILTILIRFSPLLFSLVSSIQVFQLDLNTDVTELVDYYRFVGIGNAIYFGVIPSCSIGLLSCVYLIAHPVQKGDGMLYGIMYLVIALVSFLVTRYSAVIFAISFVLLAFYMYKKPLKLLILLSVTISVLVLFYTIAARILPEKVISWAFEMFKEKDITTGSSGAVLGWWKNVNISFKTLLVGDALYTQNGAYYMRTDVGYFRQIYYGGILGISLIMYYSYRVLYYARRSVTCKDINYLLFAFFFCYVMGLAKGDINMADLYMLILVMFDYGKLEEVSLSSKE